MAKYVSPTDKDEYICSNCGSKQKHRSPYMYAPRRIIADSQMQIIDTWNVPYSTGLYILTHDTVPKEQVEQFANEKAHFPFWSLQRLGVLWSKDTWDD